MTYFLQMSCDPDWLAKNEKALVQRYLDLLSHELDRAGKTAAPRISFEVRHDFSS